MSIWIKAKINAVTTFISIALVPAFVVCIVLWVLFAPAKVNEKVKEAKEAIARRMPEFQVISLEKIHYRRNGDTSVPTYNVWADDQAEVPVSDIILNEILSRSFVDSDSKHDIDIVLWYPVVMLLAGILICGILYYFCRQCWKDLEPEYRQALLENTRMMTAKDMRRSGEDY